MARYSRIAVAVEESSSRLALVKVTWAYQDGRRIGIGFKAIELSKFRTGRFPTGDDVIPAEVALRALAMFWRTGQAK